MPRFTNEFCKGEARCQVLRDQAEAVPVPEWDPVQGHQGPLFQLWAPLT